MIALAESVQVALIGVVLAFVSGVFGLAGVIINGRNQKKPPETIDPILKDLIDDRNFWRNIVVQNNPGFDERRRRRDDHDDHGD